MNTPFLADITATSPDKRIDDEATSRRLAFSPGIFPPREHSGPEFVPQTRCSGHHAIGVV